MATTDILIQNIQVLAWKVIYKVTRVFYGK